MRTKGIRTTIRPQALIRAAGLWATSATLSMFTVSAMAATPSSDIEARYQQERADCLRGATSQERATCLKEAGAARAEARGGLLDDAGTSYRMNAMDRCENLTGDEARACIARARGKGPVSGTVNRSGTRSTITTTTGSVEGGGILRETVTREVMPVEPVAPQAPAR